MKEGDQSSEAEPRTLARLSDVAPLAILERLTAALENSRRRNNLEPTISDLANKLVLNLREVLLLTGRCVAKLREDCESRRLKAKKNEITRGWRVKRDDLEA